MKTSQWVWFLFALILMVTLSLVGIHLSKPARWLRLRSKLAETINNSSFQIYRAIHQINGHEENICFSPLAILFSFSSLVLGATGETRNEFFNVFHVRQTFPDTQELHRAFYGYLRSIDMDPPYHMLFENLIVASKDMSVHDNYEVHLQKRYRSQVTRLDFPNKALFFKFAKDLIVNGTNGEMSGSIKTPIVLNGNLVLLSVMYFHKDFMESFDLTEPRPFFESQRHVKWIPFLYKEGHFGHYSGTITDGYDLVEIKYDTKLSLILILPIGNSTVENLMSDLSLSQLRTSISKIRQTTIAVYVPQMVFNTEYDLKKVGRNLGFITAFKRNANFSGISDQSQLFVSSAIHKVGFKITSRDINVIPVPVPTQSKQIIVDKPFAFIVWHHRHGLIMLAGSVFTV